MIVNNESVESKWYKSPRFRIFVHLLAGFCLMAIADNSGLSKLISQPFKLTESADVIIPIITMIFSGLLIVSGYFLSSNLISLIDKLSIKELQKSLIIFSLPVIYFMGVFPLVTAISTLIGTNSIQ